MTIVRYDFATPLYDEAIDLRQRVLRLPLGRDIADDPLAEEWDQYHVGALDGAGRLVGTASLVGGADRALKMRQVAVDPDTQSRGIGGALVLACERLARAEGCTRIYCHARETAEGFYAACGWRAEGERFSEVGIPHVRMSRDLAP